MTTEPNADGLAPRPRRSVRFLLALMALGLLGVASMLLAPLERALPPGIEVPRAVLLIQPAILTVLAVLAGWWAAPKAGLDAPLIGAWVDGSASPSLGPIVRDAALGGVVCAAVLLAYGALTSGIMATEAKGFDLPLATRMLYGGVTEELMLRWGFMSLIAVGIVGAFRRHRAALPAAAVISAIVFGAGHLPALFALVASPPAWLILAVMAGNFVPGVVFAWLFIRRGLESAMLAHALTHAIAMGLAPIVLGEA